MLLAPEEAELVGVFARDQFTINRLFLRPITRTVFDILVSLFDRHPGNVGGGLKRGC